MSLNCGIVGLPNVGKSTLFSALTSQQVPMENYPFCTIEPNRGIVEIPDSRLADIAGIIGPRKIIPPVVEFVDIAGLVAGASKGEGLGNRFLSHIREVGLILHVVRCFYDEDVAHVTGQVDPLSDIDVVNIELALADLETVANRIEKNTRLARSDNKDVARAAAELDPLLHRVYEGLENQQPVSGMDLSQEERLLLRELNLITAKPVLYVCNVDEDGIDGGNELTRQVEERAAGDGAGTVSLCCRLEADIAGLESAEDRQVFLEEMGLQESGLDVLVREAYRLLGLRTFFTENGEELRGWTFELGEKAPRAAGRIHTDFEKGFIKAEVYNAVDLFELQDIHKIRETGKLRIEGKDYQVADGDVILFRFNTGG